MNLFNDTDLFTSGKSQTTVFDMPDADLVLYENFFDKVSSDNYYNILLNETSWQETNSTIYGKTHAVPRMISWYEDKSNPKTDKTGPDWTPELLEIKQKIETETSIKFNSVLLNLYRNGKDGVGWHSDKEMHFESHPIIASVSFGETRVFKLRHKFQKDIPQVEIPLRHGSFLLMAGTTQAFWEHQIPKTSKNILPRINLTFRRIKRKID